MRWKSSKTGSSETSRETGFVDACYVYMFSFNIVFAISLNTVENAIAESFSSLLMAGVPCCEFSADLCRVRTSKGCRCTWCQTASGPAILARFTDAFG